MFHFIALVLLMAFGAPVWAYAILLLTMPTFWLFLALIVFRISLMIEEYTLEVEAKKAALRAPKERK